MHHNQADTAIQSYLENEDIVYGATQIFDALSDYTRFQILSALCVSDCSVSELKELCHVTQSAISHQLRLLRDRGLVSAHREGQRVGQKRRPAQLRQRRQGGGEGVLQFFHFRALLSF